MEFHHNGKKYDAICKVPVQLIIGDCKSQDILCGRYGSHNCQGICRDCDFSFENSDDPLVQCTPLKACKINDFIENNDTGALKYHYFHIHDNVFKSVCFGGDEYGINGATPSELLHEFRQGVVDICLGGFYGICKATTLEWINSICNKLSIHALHQSDRDFPLTSFPKGITSLAKITPDEKMGLLLLLFLVMFTTSGMNTFFHTTFSSYHKLFHHLLVFHAFLFKEEHNNILLGEKLNKSGT